MGVWSGAERGGVGANRPRHAYEIGERRAGSQGVRWTLFVGGCTAQARCHGGQGMPMSVNNSKVERAAGAAGEERLDADADQLERGRATRRRS
jgi:hypothetical protein